MRIVHSFNFRSLTDSVDLSLHHARCYVGALSAVLGEMEGVRRVEKFNCVMAYFSLEVIDLHGLR